MTIEEEILLGKQLQNDNKEVAKLMESIDFELNKIEDKLLVEEFHEFLAEENLNESVLNEGKILDSIRWKLALFSLRFLREDSINKFFLAYYADKDGKETEKGKEFCKKSKKEKLKKMRELANEMKEDEKNKIINSQAAKEAEKRGAGSFIGAAVAGVGAGIAGYSSSKVRGSKSETMKTDTIETISGRAGVYDPGDKIEVYNKSTGEKISDTSIIHTPGPIGTDTYIKYNNKDIPSDGKYINLKDFTGADVAGDHDYGLRVADNKITTTRTGITTTIVPALVSLSSLLFGAMWGAIILAGVSAVHGVLAFNKANTLRRDEIMAELKNKKSSLKEAAILNLKYCRSAELLREFDYNLRINELVRTKKIDYNLLTQLRENINSLVSIASSSNDLLQTRDVYQCLAEGYVMLQNPVVFDNGNLFIRNYLNNLSETPVFDNTGAEYLNSKGKRIKSEKEYEENKKQGNMMYRETPKTKQREIVVHGPDGKARTLSGQTGYKTFYKDEK